MKTEKRDATADSLRQTLATSARILSNEEIFDSAGHVSARIGSGDTFLVTPLHFDVLPQDVTPKDVVTATLDGQKLDGWARLPREIWIHAKIYQARPDVMAVVHAHPQACISLGVAECEPVLMDQRAQMFGNGVPIFRTPGMVDTEDLGRQLAATLANHKAVLMKWHGITSVGASLEEACLAAIYLERNSKLQVMAMSVARTAIKGLEAAAVSQQTDVYRESFKHAWAYFASRLPRDK